MQRRLRLQRRLVHVAAPGERQADVGRAAAGGRADVGDAGHRPQRLFERPSDLDLGLVGGALAGVERNEDAGK